MSSEIPNSPESGAQQSPPRKTPGRDRPLTWREWSDRSSDVEATEPVPSRLKGLWTDLSEPARMAVRTVRHTGEDQPAPLPAHRPAWTGAAVRPRSAHRFDQPRLHHRGLPVDPLVIWGADDRRTYNDTRYPWGCVCRVIGNGRGSGVIVGPRHVLTASHVVDWNRGASVEVHRAGSTVQATAQAVAAWSVTEISGDPGASTVDEDYAVLVTDQRLGDRFGWLGVRTYDSGWDDEDFWFNMGYPTDVASGLFPIFQRDKKLDEDEWDYGSGRAMTTAADVAKGQSGGPMFAFWADGPYVVAVVSAIGDIFASGTENWCSGGSDLTRLVREARQNDP